MRILVCLVSVFSACVAIAQESDRILLNNSHRPVGPFDKAVFYREVEILAENLKVSDYYLSNDSLAMQGVFVGEGKDLTPHGACSYYFENGKLRYVGSYNNGVKIGLWKTYYETGQQSDEEEYANNDDVRLLQHWDVAGIPTLKDGAGRYSAMSDAGRLAFIEVENYKRIFSYYLETASDTVYLSVQKNAEFIGGKSALNRYIADNLKYPKKARRLEVEGTVFISFRVDHKGRVSNAEVVKGIGAGCDEEALALFNDKMRWHPGEVRGKPVVSLYILPFKFRLE